MANTKKENKVMKELEQKASVENVEAKEVLKQEVSKGNVTVCCGFPMGLKLSLKGGMVKLNGVPLSHIVSASRAGTFLPAGKYGTTVLTADQWEEVLAKYGKCDFIKNGIVFAKENYQEAVEVAEEKSEKDLGFEQIDPKKTKRTQKANLDEE